MPSTRDEFYKILEYGAVKKVISEPDCRSSRRKKTTHRWLSSRSFWEKLADRLLELPALLRELARKSAL